MCLDMQTGCDDELYGGFMAEKGNDEENSMKIFNQSNQSVLHSQISHIIPELSKKSECDS